MIKYLRSKKKVPELHRISVREGFKLYVLIILVSDKLHVIGIKMLTYISQKGFESIPEPTKQQIIFGVNFFIIDNNCRFLGSYNRGNRVIFSLIL